jgi:hypothetical protein
MLPRKRPTPDWLSDPRYAGIEDLDADGWDRDDFEASWTEPITEREFLRRLMASTVDMTAVHRRSVVGQFESRPS